MFRTAVRRKSCRIRPATPARLHAVVQAFKVADALPAVPAPEMRKQERD
jgi:hypothetical protein